MTRLAGRIAIVVGAGQTPGETMGNGRAPTITYKTAKAGINAMTQNMAVENAPFGIRINAILPGLMDTPMTIERRADSRVAAPQPGIPHLTNGQLFVRVSTNQWSFGRSS